MAGSVNKVIIVGNLGKDPEVRSLQNGSKICNLSVATSESWKDKATGDRKERTEWHRVVIFNDNLMQVAERYLKKGSKVYLEGQLETRRWSDQAGQEKFSTEIVLRPYRGELTLLDARETSAPQQQRTGTRQTAHAGAASYGGSFGDSGDIDSEVPF